MSHASRLCGALTLSLALLALSGCALFGPSWEQRKIAEMKSEDLDDRLDALGDVQDEATPAMRPTLELVLSTDIEPTARALAAQALGGLALPESVEQLRLSAQRDSSWIVRQRALEALTRILSAGVAGDLDFALTNDPYPTVRVAAIGLGVQTLDPKERGALLLKALRDPNKAVQLTAHKQLTALFHLDIPPDHYDEWDRALQQGQ